MAFHVACPITCRRICFCTLGFPRGLRKDVFLKEIDLIEDSLRDPWGARVSRGSTVQVQVPKVVPSPVDAAAAAAIGDGGGDGGEPAEEAAALAASAQTKRVALQRKAAAAMVAAEDYARRFEAGGVTVSSKESGREEYGRSNMNVMCRMCFLGESEGSERARKMLSCKSCGKKYHRSCLKSWAQHRDLFHWSSWTCPSCRICEVCRRTGDPNKFVFCKRCDAAYHCYCQHPPHKNVSSGPYLCPKHTRCHSCGSSVPGNGLSVRWFLGYTCCDACGRLFVKGNYCPVCLKVYRDSESTPMVCCDICQRWVHCQCDGISDERYLQFQVDGNLQYKCATCRGECYQVKDLEDAVRELWKRKDLADKELIASLRAAAGLPTQEEIFSISPFSDDEENGPVIGRSLKLSLKGLVDKSPKKNKDSGKNSSNKKSKKKKGYQALVASKSAPQNDIEGHDEQFDKYGQHDDKDDDVQSHRDERTENNFGVAGIVNHTEGACSGNRPSILKHKLVDEVMVSDEDKPSRILKIKRSRPHDSDSEDTGNQANKPNTVKAKKLVINLGPRKLNVSSNPPRPDESNRHRELEPVLNGVEDMSLREVNESRRSGGDSRGKHSGHIKGLKISGKSGKIQSEEAVYEDKHVPFGRITEGNRSWRESTVAAPSSGGAAGSETKHGESRANSYDEGSGDHDHASLLQSLRKETKPLLKFKLKKPNPENQISPVTLPTEEKNTFVKGQRSKRKRPSPSAEKSSFNQEDDVSVSNQDNSMDEKMDANWILKRLGKDAKGKRVEVHASDNSWHKGVVTGVIGASKLSVTLDDGRVKTLELGKQGVRFIPQKQKRSRT